MIVRSTPTPFKTTGSCVPTNGGGHPAPLHLHGREGGGNKEEFCLIVFSHWFSCGVITSNTGASLLFYPKPQHALLTEDKVQSSIVQLFDWLYYEIKVSLRSCCRGSGGRGSRGGGCCGGC